MCMARMHRLLDLWVRREGGFRVTETFSPSPALPTSHTCTRAPLHGPDHYRTHHYSLQKASRIPLILCTAPLVRHAYS